MGWQVRGVPIWYSIQSGTDLPFLYPIPQSGTRPPYSVPTPPILYPVPLTGTPSPYLVPHPR